MDQKEYDTLLSYFCNSEYPDCDESAKKKLRRKAADFVCRDGRLYRTKDGTDLEVVTNDNKQWVLESCHNKESSGDHRDEEETVKKVSAQYYWKTMVGDVRNFCRKCDLCQMKKRTITHFKKCMEDLSKLEAKLKQLEGRVKLERQLHQEKREPQLVNVSKEQMKRYEELLRRIKEMRDEIQLLRDKVEPRKVNRQRSPRKKSDKCRSQLENGEENEEPHPKELGSQSSKSSRFNTDYENVKKLGRGGYGKVYHVTNLVDKQEYALKRIKLCDRNYPHEKAMREVYVLAKLNHPRIVRYFCSWVEQAPPGSDQSPLDTATWWWYYCLSYSLYPSNLVMILHFCHRGSTASVGVSPGTPVLLLLMSSLRTRVISAMLLLNFLYTYLRTVVFLVSI